jgi:hypothetical protein
MPALVAGIHVFAAPERVGASDAILGTAMPGHDEMRDASRRGDQSSGSSFTIEPP